MNLFTSIIVFLMVFWTALFLVLPWGIQPDDNKEAGNMGGAPKHARMKKKFLITFVLSVVIWCVIYVLIDMEVIDFYAIAKDMIAEDYEG